MARPRYSVAIAGAAVALILSFGAVAQRAPRESQPPGGDEDRAAVAGRLKHTQLEALLKEDREKSIEDAGQISKLSEELKAELEKNDKNVLSVAVLRKAEEIEKLAKRIRGRFRRY